MKIWANTLVKNEERYLWFSLMSVLDYVDKILIWDTGSSDKTLQIIQEVKNNYPEKILFKEVGEVDPIAYTKMRQKMLDETKSDWIMILDGDEVWWDDSMKMVTQTIEKSGSDLDSIVTPYFNIVGDIYHFQKESAGRYKIDDKIGNHTIRFMNRKISGLYTSRSHGQHGYFDKSDTLIQDRNSKRRRFVQAPFLHFTHMVRSVNTEFDIKVPKRKGKYKFELGVSFPLDFYYPEVFFEQRPKNVDSVFRSMKSRELVKSIVQTPLRNIKRSLIKSKTGY
jgi:glycosyltransferase involved in cell wall biosynthesis